MKRVFFCFLLITITFISAFGQGSNEVTYYYDRNMKATSKSFAEYYKVVNIPSAENPRKQFRNYYITGELQCDGDYISIDKYDDSKTVQDKTVIWYYKNGKPERISNFSNGVLDGEHFEFYENGNMKTHAYFSQGVQSGEFLNFSEDGKQCLQVQFRDGNPSSNYGYMYSSDGFYSKVTLDNFKPVYEAPAIDEQKTTTIKGDEWPFYQKNGITVAMTVHKIRDNGRYFQSWILIANNSFFPIEFDPALMYAKVIRNKGEEKMDVYSAEEYSEHLDNWNNFEMALVGLAEGMAASSAGYSTSTTTTNYLGGSSYSGSSSVIGSGGYAIGSYSGSSTYGGTVTSTTTTYDGAKAYLAQSIASYNTALYGQELDAIKDAKIQQYLQTTTLNPGESIAGYVNIEREKGNTLEVDVSINGVPYTFRWNIKD